MPFLTLLMVPIIAELPAVAEKPKPPVRVVVIVTDTHCRRSKILRSEWDRRKWRLAELRYEIERHVRVKWVDRLQTRVPTPDTPVIVVGQEPQQMPEGAYTASGSAISALHRMVMETVIDDSEYDPNGDWW